MAILVSPEVNAVPASVPIVILFTPALSAIMLSPAFVPIRVFVTPLAVAVMRSVPVESVRSPVESMVILTVGCVLPTSGLVPNTKFPKVPPEVDFVS